jgi:hypothetical protein
MRRAQTAVRPTLRATQLHSAHAWRQSRSNQSRGAKARQSYALRITANGAKPMPIRLRTPHHLRRAHAREGLQANCVRQARRCRRGSGCEEMRPKCHGSFLAHRIIASTSACGSRSRCVTLRRVVPPPPNVYCLVATGGISVAAVGSSLWWLNPSNITSVCRGLVHPNACNATAPAFLLLPVESIRVWLQNEMGARVRYRVCQV